MPLSSDSLAILNDCGRGVSRLTSCSFPLPLLSATGIGLEATTLASALDCCGGPCPDPSPLTALCSTSAASPLSSDTTMAGSAALVLTLAASLLLLIVSTCSAAAWPGAAAVRSMRSTAGAGAAVVVGDLLLDRLPFAAGGRGVVLLLAVSLSNSSIVVRTVRPSLGA